MYYDINYWPKFSLMEKKEQKETLLHSFYHEHSFVITLVIIISQLLLYVHVHPAAASY